jgi:uncharacterized membrane protein
MLSHKDWLIVSGLIFLSIIPAIAGTVRLVQLAGAAPMPAQDIRFIAQPLPVVLHVVSSLMYCIAGALQFARSLRRRSISLHRFMGRALVPLGLVSAASGLWMTQFYPNAGFDGAVLYWVRLVVGFAMLYALCAGVAAIRNKNVTTHQHWMMRAYALGLGAGTQVFTHIPWFAFPAMQGELLRAVLMAAGWAINLAVAEFLIHRSKKQKT